RDQGHDRRLARGPHGRGRERDRNARHRPRVRDGQGRRPVHRVLSTRPRLAARQARREGPPRLVQRGGGSLHREAPRRSLMPTLSLLADLDLSHVAGGLFALALVVFGIFVVLTIMYRALYKRASADLAFVRTGMGGAKVVVDGGAFAFGSVHAIK